MEILSRSEALSRRKQVPKGREEAVQMDRGHTTTTVMRVQECFDGNRRPCVMEVDSDCCRTVFENLSENKGVIQLLCFVLIGAGNQQTAE